MADREAVKKRKRLVGFFRKWLDEGKRPPRQGQAQNRAPSSAAPDREE